MRIIYKKSKKTGWHKLRKGSIELVIGAANGGERIWSQKATVLGQYKITI